jgi:hypothetical protein
VSAGIPEHVSSRPDDRVDPHKLYPLPEILLLVVCAVLGGAEGWEAPEEFDKETLDRLRTCAAFAHGISSHDCIATVISRRRPKAVQSCFVDWTRAVAEATGGEVVAVRGHRGIENRLHRRLDVVFDDDASRIRTGNAPAIPTSIRHLCMNLFRTRALQAALGPEGPQGRLE